MPEAKAEATEPRAECPWAESVACYVLQDPRTVERGELSGEELAAFEKHLPGCACCRRTVVEFNDVIARMREIAPEPLARDLLPGILSRLDEPEPAKATSSRRASPVTLSLGRAAFLAAIAASLLAAAALGWVLLRPGPGGPARARRQSRRAAWMPRAERVEAHPPPPEVKRALDWLARSQEADGSWDARRWGGQDTFQVGLTGLAVLSFLGAGEAHLDGAPAETVERGLEFIVGQQGRGGRIGPFFGAALYNHGIASVTLLEAYARTRDAELRRPIGRALEFIRAEQDDRGGWGYLGDAASVNTSVTAWQVHALVLAASLDWPEAGAPAARGLAWLESVVGEDGRAGYRRAGDHPNGPETLTAMTALLLSVGAGEGEGARPGRAKTMRSLVYLGSRPAGEADYYRSYFLTHALRVAARSGPRRRPDDAARSGQQHGPDGAARSGPRRRPDDAAGGPGGRDGAGRPAPAEDLRGALVRRQLTTGPNSGSWSPSDRWGPTGGRVYATAMATLSLEADRRADDLVAWVRGVAR